jgi:lipopolysaccharide assembly outer membrane protein LptD (OstA)
MVERSRWRNLLFLICACALHARSQDVAADSLRIPADSSLTATTAAVSDSTRAGGGVDTIVVYSCKDSLVFNVPSREMTLYRTGSVAYQDMGLTADRITVDWTSSILTAGGLVDSNDTTGGRATGTPVMKDGGEEYKGRRLAYNFKTKRGKIDLASTAMDQGYYYGDEIKKVDVRTLFVGAGRFTTCQDPHPHYHFGSPKMKVTMQDQIVAEPVYLYISDVPVFVLPFGVFPNKGGRRSGIIAPAIVEDSRRGRLLQHLGYYWAIDDYMDLNLRTDLYTKGSWALYSDYRYALRYNFSGGISGYYKRLTSGESGDPTRSREEAYTLNLVHRQEFTPTLRADVNFTFASDNSYLNTLNQQQLLNQSIISNATLSKYWEGTPNSISLNIRRSQNLRNGNVDETLPSVSFNHSQSYPFRGSHASSNPSKLSFLEMIGVSYSASASNTRSKSKLEVDSIKTVVDGRDTIGSVSEFRLIRRQSFGQSVGISISPKVGYITVTPSLSYREDRSFSVDDKPVANTSDSSLIIARTNTRRTAGTIYTGISAGTKLYGIVQPGVFGIAALRHTITPSLSLVYAKQIVGEDASGKQLSMNFNVGNVFEMKKMASEEGKEPEKIQLLNVGGGFSYNFAAESLKFSPIGLSFRTDIGSILSIDGGTTFDLYKLEQTGLQSYNRVNKFLLSEGEGLARMTNFRLSLSTSLSGDRSSRSGEEETDTTKVEEAKSGTFGLYEEKEPDFSIPWRLSLSLDYAENKELPSRYRSSSLRGNLEFNLTENWKFAVSGGYDMVNREIVVPNISISRDLHCWLMDFSWVPLGTNPYFRLEIRVKAPQLQDVKVTKQGSSRGIY